MTDSLSKRRMTENEVVFRQHNEAVQQSLETLARDAQEDSMHELAPNGDLQLHFYCECSDENCHKRIVTTARRYKDIHRERDHFIVLCGHEVPAVERIVSNEGEFCVVQKYADPPEYVARLQPTEVDNT